MSVLILKYRSGEEIKKGDRVLFHGNPAEVELVAFDPNEPEHAWYVQEFGSGVMILDPIVSGRTFIVNRPTERLRGFGICFACGNLTGEISPYDSLSLVCSAKHAEAPINCPATAGQRFDGGKDDADRARYQKYKWLCLTSLGKRFVAPKTEELVSLEYFTTLPTWDNAKKFRHETYISAQKLMGVNVTLGEFKRKTVSCRANCKREFDINVEKQTDVNIALAMNGLAERYDKLLLLTADSNQVPTIKLLRLMHPEKRVAVIVPIGRKAKELKEACAGNAFKITEEHLFQCQLPNPIPIMRGGRQTSLLVKPLIWS